MARPTSPFGILGLGMEVPSTVRTNEWWPESFAKRFEERSERDISTPAVWLDRAESPSQRIQIEEMLKTYGDPFRGAKERRIAAPGERTSDYELKAAQKAMANAGVGPEDIDFMLVFSVPPDQYLPGDGAALHHRLGIRRGLVANVDLACASFVGGLAIADSMLRAGQANMVLFVTGELLSR